MEARGRVVIDGIDKAIKDFNVFKGILTNVNLKYKDNRKHQAKIVSAFKKTNPVIAKAVGNQKYFAGALKNVNAALKVSSALAKEYAKNATKIKTPAAIAKTTVVTKKAASATETMRSRIVRLASAMKKSTITWRNNANEAKGWWHSFGRVAIGFGIAYRLINLVENSIVMITESFRAGIATMDQYIESVATVSGMLALLSAGGSYKERFEGFSEVMGGTMRETIRIMPKFKLSMEEVGNAYKELAQFGVIVTKANVAKTLTATAMIKEIAATTSGGAKQVRQEIQAIFNGTLRVSEQYGKFLNKFPELHDKIYGINKLVTSNAEKWQLAIDAIAEYSLAIVRGNETFGAQGTIIKNTLQIISMDSLKLTGIYDKWVKKLKAISESLLDNQGNLGDLGRKVVRLFGAGWIAIENSRIALFGLVKTFGNYSNALNVSLGGLTNFIAQTGMFIVTAKLASIAIKKMIKLVMAFNLHWLLLGVAAFFAYSAFQVWMDKGLGDGLKAIAKYATEIYETISKLIDKIINFDLPKYLEPKDKRKMSAVPNAFGGWDLVWDEVTPEKPKAPEAPKILGIPDAGDIFGATGVTDNSLTTTKDFFGDVAGKMETSFDKVRALLLKFTTGLGFGDFESVSDTLFDVEGAEASAARIAELLKKYTMQQTAAFEEVKTKAKDTWEYVSDGFSTQFTDIISGEITSFNDLWKSMISNLRDTWAEAMSDMATDAINNFFRRVAQEARSSGSSFFGTALKAIGGAIVGAFGGSSGGEAPVVPTIGNTGSGMGMIVRAANGGIIPEPVFGVGASGQHYSFAEEGPERVLSNSDSFGSTPSTTNVTVEVINKSSQQVKGRQGATSMSLKGMVTQIILEDKGSNGPIARGMA